LARVKKKAASGKKSRRTLDFERPLTTVDLAIFSLRADELCVLLVRRGEGKNEPFPGHFALPGGFVDVEQDADLVSCARRKLLEKTNVEANYLEQVGSWGNAIRDPRGWSSTHVYFALIPFKEDIPPADGAAWIPVKKVPRSHTMAFDHQSLINASVDRLLSKVEYTSLPAYLLTAPFTLPQLQQVYEVILDRKLDKSSFRTRTLTPGFLQETGLIQNMGPRPAMGYKIKSNSGLVYFPRPLKGAS